MNSLLDIIREANSARIPDDTILVNGTLTMDSPAITLLLVKYQTLKINAQIITMTSRYYQRPDYVSYDYYGTTEYWYIIMYINDCFSFSDFTMSSFYLPQIDTITDLVTYPLDTQTYNYTVNANTVITPQYISTLETTLLLPTIFQQTSFTATVEIGQLTVPLTYIWNTGDGNITQTFQGSLSYTYNKPGLYNFSVIISDGTTQITLSQNVCCHFNTAPNIYDITTTNNTNYTVQFITNSCDQYTYQWLLNNELIPNSNMQTVEISQLPIYNLSVTVCDSLNRCTTFTKQINLTDSIPDPTGTVIIPN